MARSGTPQLGAGRISGDEEAKELSEPLGRCGDNGDRGESGDNGNDRDGGATDTTHLTDTTDATETVDQVAEVAAIEHLLALDCYASAIHVEGRSQPLDRRDPIGPGPLPFPAVELLQVQFGPTAESIETHSLAVGGARAGARL